MACWSTFLILFFPITIYPPYTLLHLHSPTSSLLFKEGHVEFQILQLYERKESVQKDPSVLLIPAEVVQVQSAGLRKMVEG